MSRYVARGKALTQVGGLNVCSLGAVGSSALVLEYHTPQSGVCGNPNNQTIPHHRALISSIRVISAWSTVSFVVIRLKERFRRVLDRANFRDLSSTTANEAASGYSAMERWWSSPALIYRASANAHQKSRLKGS